MLCVRGDVPLPQITGSLKALLVHTSESFTAHPLENMDLIKASRRLTSSCSSGWINMMPLRQGTKVL